MAKALMFQGTGSDVGKSLLVAGLARAFTKRGLRVAPFKPQNMSNNAAVTVDGGEIGRAQALQAKAAGLAPIADMNPVLLKPQSMIGSQVVVQGKVWGAVKARDYQSLKPQLMPSVLQSFDRLGQNADLVLVEGAGSAAEVNLRKGDIANMGFACATGTPVVLIGDIDRGGVIASIVGTHALLPPEERALLAGYIINKFRGDTSLFDTALDLMKDTTGLDCFGIATFFDQAGNLPAEDAVILDKSPSATATDTLIVVPKLPHIANFDDFDPLTAEPGVTLAFVPLDQAMPLEAKAVILPGSKTSISDMAALRASGWDIDLKAYHRRGGRILGVCGGFQMLGHSIADPDGIEGEQAEIPGLGLLDIKTVLEGDKTLTQSKGWHCASGEAIEGYEIHIGKTKGPDCQRPFAHLPSGPDGAVDPHGQVAGTYLHGAFSQDSFRAWWLESLGLDASALGYNARVETTLDALAQHLESCLDLDGLLSKAR